MNRDQARETVQVVQVPETGMTHYRKAGGVSLCGLDVSGATPVGVVSTPSCSPCRGAFARSDDTEQVSPEADTDDRAIGLWDYLQTATKDELAVIEDVAARVLGVGRVNYADALDIANDSRDFRREARDELLDALFYQSVVIKRLEGLQEHANERDQIERQLQEIRGGDGVYYVPQSYAGASALDWDAVIPIDGNRRLVKRVVGSPTGPANEEPVRDDESYAWVALQIAALRDEVSALRHNQETDRRRIEALEAKPRGHEERGAPAPEWLG